ncbi:MAG TPA: conjugal transfer protein TrbE [Sphingomicrobium sp.]|nr:conjugal transfer protein TrbE [Sphingomicrobium sp.]
MLNLAEYRAHSDRLADHLPWAALVGPGVVLNKDGSFQRSFAFRGPDLESATEAELVSVSARANNMLKRFGSGWALFFEAERIEALGYPKAEFPDPGSWLVDEERKASFEGGREHFESRYYLTLVWLPPVDVEERVERALVERRAKAQERDWREALQSFIAETDRALDLMSGFMPEVRALDDDEALTFLHRAVSPASHRVVAPETPIYLDALLADTPLSGGLEPMLGDLHLRTLTVLGFPSLSRPGILDTLNHQDFSYRWVTRFIPLDRTEAARALTKLRRQWFNKRKSVSALLREVMYNQPVQLTDSDADNKVVDADEALQELGGDHVAFGYLTTTITVADEDPSRADEKVRAIERIVNGLGFTIKRERMNAVEAWLSSLPGQVYANVRQPLVHTLNLAHVMPLSSTWAGPAQNNHLSGPPLLFAETSGSTPFRLSTHVGDVGHMLIVGPTGAGKSVLLALLALQFRRYPGSRIIIFDKGWSARTAVLAMGGAHHELGVNNATLTFQPLRRIDEPAERSWAADWLLALMERQGLRVTPDIGEALWSALLSLASAPPEERTLTGFSLLLQSNALKSALQPYTLEGPFGPLLDATKDALELADVHCFETETLMRQADSVSPVLSYLFHRLEESFDGSPTLLLLDEAWLFLDHPIFAARIREWLKVLRKKNVAVIFATQSLADIGSSSIATAIIESCPQRIFLANDRAIEPQIREIYDRFGLNPRQVELIARATPKRDYYLQSRSGNRLFDLALGPIALALCGTSDAASRLLVDEIVKQHGTDRFLAHLLQVRGLNWAAPLLDQFAANQEGVRS